ncbi:MAG: hypothetical protein M3R26_00250 [Actinomycetota bacterium]|nr:hypothetical protein [Actinomycetota bacterium]
MPSPLEPGKQAALPRSLNVPGTLVPTWSPATSYTSRVRPKMAGDHPIAPRHQRAAAKHSNP